MKPLQWDRARQRHLWSQLYHYIQANQSCSAADAEDLTQEVFQHLLRKDRLNSMIELAIDENHLLCLLRKTAKNWLIDRYRRAKRRELSFVSLDDAIEHRASTGSDPAQEASARELKALEERCQEEIRQSFLRRGNRALYHELQARLYSVRDRSDNYAHPAAKLGMTTCAFRAALSRFRRVYRNRIAQEWAAA